MSPYMEYYRDTVATFITKNGDPWLVNKYQYHLQPSLLRYFISLPSSLVINPYTVNEQACIMSPQEVSHYSSHKSRGQFQMVSELEITWSAIP